ncbi:hypothetical protein SB767_31790, partial [Bacillus sp. SIMBA_069]
SELRDRSETRQQHARAARTGAEIRVGHGAYVARLDWDGLAERERYLLRLSAFARTRVRTPTFSHWSAAVIHGLPFIGPIPSELHVTVG